MESNNEITNDDILFNKNALVKRQPIHNIIDMMTEETRSKYNKEEDLLKKLKIKETLNDVVDDLMNYAKSYYNHNEEYKDGLKGILDKLEKLKIQ